MTDNPLNLEIIDAFRAGVRGNSGVRAGSGWQWAISCSWSQDLEAEGNAKHLTIAPNLFVE